MRKRNILRRQGSVAKHFNLRAGTKVGIVYAYNIESPLARWWQPPKVFPRYLGHLAPFVPVHGGLGSLHIPRCPSLNFNKTKHISIPANQVDFASILRRTKIARHDHIAQLPQMEERFLFAIRTGAEVSRPRIRRQDSLTNPIQPANDRSRDYGRKHSGNRSFTLSRGRNFRCDFTHKLVRFAPWLSQRGNGGSPKKMARDEPRANQNRFSPQRTEPQRN